MALTKTTKRDRTTADSAFTKPEIEAAWLLIQLSGDSDEDHLSSLQSDGDNRNDDDLLVFIKDLGKKKGQEKDREIQEQSSSRSRSRTNYNYSDDATTSSAMSGTTVTTKFLKRNRSGGEIDDEDEDDSEGVAYGMKRRNKKYRSVNELSSQTKPLQIKLLA